MKRYDQLEITDSFMFAKVMSDKEICKATLEQILNIKIRDIKYLDYEETIQVAPGAKGVRLDIYVEDDKNTVFNLEMQTTSYAELPKRSRYYQDVIDLNIIEKGDTYDILGVSYVIFICTFDFFKKDRSVYEFENICVEDANIRLNDGTHKIFLNTKGDRDGIEQGMKQGIEQGKKQGVQQATEDINKLIKVLLSQKKYDELEKMSEDKEYQNELMKKYNIIE